MAMGDRPGFLVYSADGSKVSSFQDLPEWLRREIRTELPLYEHAPECYLKARNVSSWSYFARYKADYDAGARFPRPAPLKAETCEAPPPAPAPEPAAQ